MSPLVQNVYSFQKRAGFAAEQTEKRATTTEKLFFINKQKTAVKRSKPR